MCEQLTGRYEHRAAKHLENRLQSSKSLSQANDSQESPSQRGPSEIARPAGKGDDNLGFYAHIATCITLLCNLRKWIAHHVDSGAVNELPEPVQFYEDKFFTGTPKTAIPQVTLNTPIVNSVRSKAGRIEMLTFSINFWRGILRHNAAVGLFCPAHLPDGWTLPVADAGLLGPITTGLSSSVETVLEHLHAEGILPQAALYFSPRRQLQLDAGQVTGAQARLPPGQPLQSRAQCDLLFGTALVEVFSPPPPGVADVAADRFHVYKRWAAAFLRSVGQPLDCTCQGSEPPPGQGGDGGDGGHGGDGGDGGSPGSEADWKRKLQERHRLQLKERLEEKMQRLRAQQLKNLQKQQQQQPQQAPQDAQNIEPA